MTYSQDMWLRPVVLTSANNKFRLTDASTGEIIVVVPVGTYYLHADSVFSSSAFKSLYLTIESALNISAAMNTYTFSNATPTQSGGQHGVGLALSADIEAFAVDFSDVDFTMDQRWFGFESSDGTVVSASNRITGKYTVYHQWYLNTISANAQASNKRGSVQREISYSHDRPSDRYGIEWYSERTRPIVYEYVPAAHVFDYGATEQIYADVGRLALGDTNNAWETIWSGLSRDETIFIVHNVAGKWNLRNLTTGSVESVKLFDEGQARDLDSTITLTRSAGELYTISLNLWIGETQGYSH